MIDLTSPENLKRVSAALEKIHLFIGMRIEGTTIVKADDREISPRRSLALRNHSPDGFNWGYGGSGPAQLALALLLEAGLPDELAERFYQDFKWDVVARFDQECNWYFPGDKMREWIKAQLTTEWAKQVALQRKEEFE